MRTDITFKDDVSPHKINKKIWLNKKNITSPNRSHAPMKPPYMVENIAYQI